MTAHFYITKELFNNVNLCEDALVDKINRLNIEIININRYKQTNHLYITDECYSELIWDGHPLLDIWNEDCSFDRDARNIILLLLQNYSNQSSRSHEEVIDFLKEEDENNINGIIYFSENSQIDRNLQVIIPNRRWSDFRRYFLGLYPKNPRFFIDECGKYFDKIFFHERTKDTVADILSDCSFKIIHHLSVLNDSLFDIIAKNPYSNRQTILNSLSIIGRFDETATLEGNAARKSDFTFNFLDAHNVSINVCCEPHIKLCRTDNYPGDSSYNTNRRIYFHEGKSHIHEGKILIGHIGLHL